MLLVLRNLPINVGDRRDAGLIPGLGGSPGGGNGNRLQCSCLESPTDKGAWWATVHGIAVRHNLATELQAQALLMGGAMFLLRKVVWPEAPQHGHLQAVGRGWILALMSWREGPT